MGVKIRKIPPGGKWPIDSYLIGAFQKLPVGNKIELFFSQSPFGQSDFQNRIGHQSTSDLLSESKLLLQEIGAFREMHYSNIFLMFL